MHQSSLHHPLQRHGISEEGAEFALAVGAIASAARPSVSRKSFVRLGLLCTNGGSSALVVVQLLHNGTAVKLLRRAREDVAQLDVLAIEGSTGSTTSIAFVYGGKLYTYAPGAVKTASETAAGIKALLEADGHTCTERTTVNPMAGQPQTYLLVQHSTTNKPCKTELTVTAGNGTTAISLNEFAVLKGGGALAAGDAIQLDSYQEANEKGYLDVEAGDRFAIEITSEDQGADAGAVAYSMAFAPPYDARRQVEFSKHIDTDVGRLVPARRSW